MKTNGSFFICATFTNLKNFLKTYDFGLFFASPVPLQVRGVFQASQMNLENLIHRKLNTSASTRAFQLVRHDLERVSGKTVL